MKKCCTCQQLKDLSEFDKNRATPDGLNPRCRECRALYRKLNREKLAKDQANYRQRTKHYVNKYRNDEEFREFVKYTSIVRNSLKYKYTTKSKAYKLIGCTYDELISFIGERPDSSYELDHRCPISQAKSIEEVIKLQHYSNLQWISKEDNIKKYNNKTVSGVILCKELLGRDWID